MRHELHHIHRFQNRYSAVMVSEQMNKLLTNTRVEFMLDPVDESESKKGVGDWLVFYQPCSSMTAYAVKVSLDACLELSLQLVLAAELAKFAPKNLLLRNWHLNPENADSVSKISVPC